MIKLGLFEPDGACSTATRNSKQSSRDNIRALAAHGGTYRVSDNCALRRSCGDNLRASEKTAPTEEAAATPDSAETKALTLNYAGAGESYKISVLEGVHTTRCVAWTPLIDPPRGVWRVNYPKSPKRFCLFRRRQRHFLSHLSNEAYRSVGGSGLSLATVSDTATAPSVFAEFSAARYYLIIGTIFRQRLCIWTVYPCSWLTMYRIIPV